MNKKIPVPVPLRYTEKISALKCGGNLYFPDANRSSIQSICSRLKDSMAREFITKTDRKNGGIRVWRIA